MNSNAHYFFLYDLAISVGLVVGATLLYLWVFWLLYVLVMGLYRAWLDKRLRGLPLVMGAPVVVVGYLVDLVANWTIATLVFWDLPRRPLELVTDRLIRYMRQPVYLWGWRNHLASRICNDLLDHFDPTGAHCD